MKTVLQNIANDVQVMVESSTEFIDKAGHISKYCVDADVLHKIIGRLSETGIPITVPHAARSINVDVETRIAQLAIRLERAKIAKFAAQEFDHGIFESAIYNAMISIASELHELGVDLTKLVSLVDDDESGTS
jgi:hypothetical protein